eukprot:352550-Chlamydomonas_euryale.AAC.3
MAATRACSRAPCRMPTRSSASFPCQFSACPIAGLSTGTDVAERADGGRAEVGRLGKGGRPHAYDVLASGSADRPPDCAVIVSGSAPPVNVPLASILRVLEGWALARTVGILPSPEGCSVCAVCRAGSAPLSSLAWPSHGMLIPSALLCVTHTSGRADSVRELPTAATMLATVLADGTLPAPPAYVACADMGRCARWVAIEGPAGLRTSTPLHTPVRECMCARASPSWRQSVTGLLVDCCQLCGVVAEATRGRSRAALVASNVADCGRPVRGIECECAKARIAAPAPADAGRIAGDTAPGLQLRCAPGDSVRFMAPSAAKCPCISLPDTEQLPPPSLGVTLRPGEPVRLPTFV